MGEIIKVYRLFPLLGSTSEDELRMEEVDSNYVTEKIVRAHRNVRIAECGRYVKESWYHYFQQ